MADCVIDRPDVADCLVFYLVDKQDLSCGHSDVWQKSNYTGDDKMATILGLEVVSTNAQRPTDITTVVSANAQRPTDITTVVSANAQRPTVFT